MRAERRRINHDASLVDPQDETCRRPGYVEAVACAQHRHSKVRRSEAQRQRLSDLFELFLLDVLDQLLHLFVHRLRRVVKLRVDDHAVSNSRHLLLSIVYLEHTAIFNDRYSVFQITDAFLVEVHELDERAYHEAFFGEWVDCHVRELFDEVGSVGYWKQLAEFVV